MRVPRCPAKLLGLLTEIVPGLSRVGVLRQVGYPEPPLEAAAQRLNVEVYVVDVGTIDELESAFAAMRRKQVGAVIIRGPLFYVRRQQVADLALKHRLPAIHALKEYAQAGLLVTYGANLRISIGGPPATSTGSSGAPSRATCPSSNQRSSTW